MLKRWTARFLLSFSVCFLAVSTLAQEKVDLDMVNRIRYEGFHNSKIMEIASGLMDGIGQRLTGSPNMKRANEWTRDKLTEFGLSNAHLEPWSPFGRGWSNEYVNVRMVTPDIAPLLAYAKAWTPGTNGEIRAQVVRVIISGPQDIPKYKGKLGGKILGCRELVVLHDAQGHPLLVTTHRGDYHLTIGLPEMLHCYEQATGQPLMQRVVVDREGMAAEFLAQLTLEGRQVVRISLGTRDFDEAKERLTSWFLRGHPQSATRSRYPWARRRTSW